MFILAKGGETYARLKFGCGPGAELLVPVAIAWDAPFAASDDAAWEQEYERCVRSMMPPRFPDHRLLSSEDLTFLEENSELLPDWGFPTWDDDLESERKFAFNDETDEPIPL
jgi:hypothetical protein